MPDATRGAHKCRMRKREERRIKCGKREWKKLLECQKIFRMAEEDIESASWTMRW